jgi:Domain of unknown function (DUF222)
MFDGAAELNQLNTVLDRLLDGDLAPGDGAEARELVAAAEAACRRLGAVQVRLLDEVERTGAFSADGHASAKVMIRHVAKLSNGSAAARQRGARMVPRLADVGAALAAGTLGLDQFDLLGRVFANPRVRDAMVDAQAWFLRLAARLSYADFELEVRQWERLADADGPEPADSGGHENRDVSLVQDFDLSWTLAGGFGALQGAAIHEIFGHYIDAERLTDWEKARAEHGDEATVADLPRRESQRRADALWQVFQDAAKSGVGTVPVDFVHNIVWGHDTFEEITRRLGGAAPQPLDPATYRCETLDGVPLEPMEAAANALVEKFRRVVVDASGVVIDLGRARTFTGGARLAAQLAAPHCLWPGCAVPTSRCEIDHSIDHADGGLTNPGNGAPFCGRHNRWKQKGFSVWRDPCGEWHVHRPDGTEIE